VTGDPPRETGAQVIRSEERLRVDTTWQPYERVRLARRVVTELRQVDIEVRREELVIERDAIPDPGDASGRPGRPRPDRVGGDLVIVLSEEVPMITMGTRAYERVRVSVQQVDEQRALSEQVRREEVVIDNDGVASS